MNILINALGIKDSGGIRVFEKMLKECTYSKKNKYIVVCNKSENIEQLYNKYNSLNKFEFMILPAKGFINRLYFENIHFRKIIKAENIDLIYNFSGTTQLFLKIPQLLKIQNLLFYTKKLNSIYMEKGMFLLWVKQIYLKQIIFNFMSNRSSYMEVQSKHVEKYMSDFINIENKTFFLKSDISVEENKFAEPKKYNNRQKIKFLYIVGPHFEYVHKNFVDLTNVMIEFQKLNKDFEINITLTKTQLINSDIWDVSLNDKTNFLGYISDDKEMDSLFCDNTILISTSVIETLGLHVVEAIKKGIIPIVPSEKYSYSVYGENILTYKLFDAKSLLNSILSIINNKIDSRKYIEVLQNDLKTSENSKYSNIVDIFQKVIDVQK